MLELVLCYVFVVSNYLLLYSEYPNSKFWFFRIVVFKIATSRLTVICWEWETLGETVGVSFHCHLLGYFTILLTTVAFRSCETLNLYVSSGIWGHLSLKTTNSLVIFRLRKPLKTSTRLAGHGIWTRELPNASLVRYHGPTSLDFLVCILIITQTVVTCLWMVMVSALGCST